MKNLKRSIKTLLVICMTALLCACGNNTSKFDPKAYSEGLMVLLTTGKTEKIISCGMKEEEANETYNHLVEVMNSEVASQLDAFEVSEETKALWSDMMFKLMGSCKYEVKDAVSTENGYDVDVVITPVEFTKMSDDEEFTEELQQEVMDAYEAKKIDMDTIYEFTFNLTASKLINALDNPTFGEPSIVTIHFEKNDKGEYAIKDELETGNKIGTAMFN